MRQRMVFTALSLCLCVNVARGVDAPPHWAFQPLQHAVPPTVKNTEAVSNEIDRFIVARLEKEGLKPSREADRRTLIRRATFDLTGLPPSAEEVESFVKNAGPASPSYQSYEALIDRLLANPHYGEQWARHWLDIARYSDTKGYVYAREEKRWVHAWAYRDWVVQALNRDLPYDRFLKLQIAADQLVPSHSPDLAAMGFLTIGRRFLGVTHDIIDDRIDVVMRGTQGLTVACARCHDHKYDPISLRDYYSLYGVFQSCAEALVPCSSATNNKALEALQKTLRDTTSKRREEQMARTRAKIREHLEAQLELEKYPQEGFDQIIEEKDLNPFIVRRWQNYLAKDKLRKEPVFAEWHAQATKNDTAAMRAAAGRYAEELTNIDQLWQAYRKVHPAATKLPDARDEALRSVLYGLDSPCYVPDEHIANIEMYFPTGVITELWKLQADVDRWLLQTPEAPAFATVLVDRPLPSTPRVFLRGNPLTKGDEVPRQFLPVLAQGKPTPFAKGSGRLELANDIADPRNPLTARVMVNRVWQHHFGRGLVATESDFGKRADPPTHPELLDWLARRFMDSGWSLKALHRIIMTSAAYRRESMESATPQSLAQLVAVDPDNRLLARMAAHRLTFEESRDGWLAVAGKLELPVGGKPVPLFGKENRRTLYGMIDRESVPSVLRTFDFANPDLSIAHRSETTVPQQALFVMNHPFVVQQAKALLKRPEIIACKDDAARVQQLYARLFQRSPTRGELSEALSYVRTSVGTPPLAANTAGDWRYGVGEWSDDGGKVVGFKVFPHFTGDAWRGDDAWPNAALGWAQLTATGGHPGNDRKHAVVRRWTAPMDGTYSVASRLVHEPEVGDGIRAFIAHSRLGKLRSLELRHDSADINFAALEFKAGDTLDFVVDINRELNSNQFLLAPVISRAATAGSGGDAGPQRWDAKRDFGNGMTRSGLTYWEELVQVLMLSNEFMFVD